LLGRIRARSEEATLRTTFIVGFPGETRDHFEELKSFVEKHRFDRLGSFIYSREEETGAAALPGHISEEEKTARLDELMRLQHDIALDRNNSLIGKIVEVIIDAVRSENVAQGRTRADCPDIDQEVIVTGDRMSVGQFMSVRIDAVNEYDLVGSVQAG
jgi:ribosomal protein S12 methylthiotransferase